MTQALEILQTPILIRSTLEIPEARRADLRKTLQEKFSSKLELRFETVPDLISGIELSVHGWKLAWSVSDYLETLVQSVKDTLPQPKAPA